MNKLTLKDAIKELEELSTGDWVPYEYTPEEAKLILNHINNLQSKIDKAIKYIEKNTHNIYADGYRDRETGRLLSKEKTPIIDRVFSRNPKDLLDILKEDR